MKSYTRSYMDTSIVLVYGVLIIWHGLKYIWSKALYAQETKILKELPWYQNIPYVSLIILVLTLCLFI